MEFTEHDYLLIKQAHKNEKIWSGDELKPVRDKIKASILTDDSKCCYCQRSFKGEFKMVIDVEHILPSSIFRDYCFDHRNLSLACKRCNMEIKKDNIDFLEGGLKIIGDSLKSKKNIERYISNLLGGKNEYLMSSLVDNRDYYKIIHPILDVYSDNNRIVSISLDAVDLVAYKCLTDKGRYTFNFFKLDEFQVNSFDTSQNLNEILNKSLILISDII